MTKLRHAKARAVEAATRACARLFLPRGPVDRGSVRDVGTLDFRGAVCILVPHPDDEVIGCFHFIEKAGKSAAIDLIYVTDSQNAELASQRRGESARATGSMPVRSREYWQYGDGTLAAHSADLQLQIGMLASRYQLVLSPNPTDRTLDHAALAHCAMATVPPAKLLWYRSTWLTFPVRHADIVATGDVGRKLDALGAFSTQRALALANVVHLSTFEASRVGLLGKSIEGFRFAGSGPVSFDPINSISVRSGWQLRAWL